MPSFKINCRLITTPKDIANKLPTFLCQLVHLIAVPSRTALDWLWSSCEVVGDQFHITPVTALEVQKKAKILPYLKRFKIGPG